MNALTSLDVGLVNKNTALTWLYVGRQEEEGTAGREGCANCTKTTCREETGRAKARLRVRETVTATLADRARNRDRDSV